jgi:outer membrane protein TolC
MKALFVRRGVLLSGVLAFLAFMAAEPCRAVDRPSRGPVVVASGTVRLSLAECVALSVRRNTTIRLSYLDRVVEKYAFITDTSFTFRPDLTMGTNATRAGGNADDGEKSAAQQDSLSTAVKLDQRLPTGGQIGVLWQPWNRSYLRRSSGEDTSDSTARSSNWSFNLSQPLLRGAGTGIGTLSVRRARIGEHLNVLQLKQTVMDNVTAVIKAYRSLVWARLDVEINRTSLDRARTLLETNQLLIKLGRMAPQDIIQSEADLADKELALEVAHNALDRARLDLLRLLDLSKFLQIVPDEEIECPPFTFTEEQVLALAREHQPGFLSMGHELELARLALLQARDTLKWDLSLTGGMGGNRVTGQPSLDNTSRDWNIGLSLTVPVWGPTRRDRRAGLMSAETYLEMAEINLRKFSDNLELECLDAVRQLRTLEKQIGLAGRARHLSEQKLAVEQEKLRAGRSSNFQIVTYQDDLRNAKISELSAKISYLNSLSDLDTFMGTMVDTWGIDLNDRRPQDGPRSASEPAGLRLVDPADQTGGPATPPASLGIGEDLDPPLLLSPRKD